MPNLISKALGKWFVPREEHVAEVGANKSKIYGYAAQLANVKAKLDEQLGINAQLFGMLLEPRVSVSRTETTKDRISVTFQSIPPEVGWTQETVRPIALKIASRIMEKLSSGKRDLLPNVARPSYQEDNQSLRAQAEKLRSLAFIPNDEGSPSERLWRDEYRSTEASMFAIVQRRNILRKALEDILALAESEDPHQSLSEIMTTAKEALK